MTIEVQVGDHKYLIGKLNAREQYDVFRRLGPSASIFEQELDQVHAPGVRFAGGVYGDMLGRMPQSDSDWILNTCLNVVKRITGATPAPIFVSGRLAYEDIDMGEMLELVDLVIEDNLRPFFERLRKVAESRIQANQTDSTQ